MNSILNLLKMSELQRSVAQLRTEGDLLISGGPGSGKTRSLLGRAAILAADAGVAADQYRVFLSSRAAVVSESFTLQDFKIPEASVMTLMEWGRDYWASNDLGPVPILASGQENVAGILAGVLDHLRKREISFKRYKFVMVDDGQVLDTVSYRILRLIADHLSIAAYDGFQLIDAGSSTDEIWKILRPGGTRVSLDGNHRNPKSIAKLASLFGEQIGSCEKKMVQGKSKYVVSGDTAADLESLATALNEKASRKFSNAVILPNETAVRFVQNWLNSRGTATRTGGDSATADAAIMVLTYEAASGLTFDNVFLPSLSEEFWRGINSEQRIKMLYLGITRAVQWVYVSTIEGSRLEEHEILKSASSKKLLHMKECPSSATFRKAWDLFAGHSPQKGSENGPH